jgi:ABC-type Zn2+ transport system substrate-binding protein/surface adhesin
MKAMPEIPLESGAYYIFDRGYNVFEQLFRIDTIGAFFVVRAKTEPQVLGKEMEALNAERSPF